MHPHAVCTVCIKPSSGGVICVFQSFQKILVLLLSFESSSSIRRFNLSLRSSALRVKMLHLNCGCWHSETEVLVGSNVRYSHRFVLDVTGRHRFILVQLKWTGHGFWLGVVALALSLLASAHSSTSSAPRSARASICTLDLALSSSLALALVPILLCRLCCHDCRCSQLLRVVFLHVFHQIRLLRWGEDRQRGNSGHMTTRCKVAASCLLPERRFIVFHVEMLFRNGHLSYWGIRTVAETTRVDPRMFDCVCRHVHLQAGWIYISFIAIRALVGLVLVVLTPVRLGKEQC